MVRGFKDDRGKFHPTEGEFGIPRRSTKRRSVETGTGRKQQIQMARIQKRFPNDKPQPDPIGNISSTERMLAESEVDAEIDNVGFSDNLYEFDNNQEWWIFNDFEKAKEQAIDQEASVFEGDSSVAQGFLERFPDEDFVFITDTDRRIISSEEADREAESQGLSDDERDQLSDDIEEKLKNPVDYFVNETGQMSFEDLIKQNFIRVNTDAMAVFVVENDGVAPTLASKTGNEVILFDKDGKERLYMYRVN